jgi:hypothetical protein
VCHCARCSTGNSAGWCCKVPTAPQTLRHPPACYLVHSTATAFTGQLQSVTETAHPVPPVQYLRGRCAPPGGFCTCAARSAHRAVPRHPSGHEVANVVVVALPSYAAPCTRGGAVYLGNADQAHHCLAVNQLRVGQRKYLLPSAKPINADATEACGPVGSITRDVRQAFSKIRTKQLTMAHQKRRTGLRGPKEV